eukprot:5623851-Prorocentrum_lima.AAC.1
MEVVQGMPRRAVPTVNPLCARSQQTAPGAYSLHPQAQHHLTLDACLIGPRLAQGGIKRARMEALALQ